MATSQEGQVEELLKEVKTQLTNFQVSRQKLIAQLSENEMAKTELELTKETDEVFKLVGPVLFPQNRDEALEIVTKQHNRIKEELVQIEKQSEAEEKKGEDLKKRIIALKSGKPAEGAKK
ncbi:MAG: hypothetical protein EZS28_024796 [Streblomastix strix]|uniref:Prefoldin subunit 6 n=1 Tax=Streblomastix strix TaxID=222440 RepID=A0A5J4VAR1_9EUKA|nr:MAG: hypothetical protein EZS28_024796 [Streblomastix strix]